MALIIKRINVPAGTEEFRLRYISLITTIYQEAREFFFQRKISYDISYHV